AYAKSLIEGRYNIKLPEIQETSLDSEEAKSLFRNVRTQGIFQFLTWSQRNFHKELRPDSFNELVQSVALIRPGPIAAGYDKDLISIKFGKKNTEYEHPDLIPILEETHGLIIYQEQIMEIAKKICGFSGSDADHLRKAVGKKDLDKMREWEDSFKSGGRGRGYDEDLLNHLWDTIVEFASYCFNKAHSVSYTLISWYQAFLKANYPAEYWSAIMQ